MNNIAVQMVDISNNLSHIQYIQILEILISILLHKDLGGFNHNFPLHSLFADEIFTLEHAVCHAPT